jgi:hypothetical protein
MYKKIIGLIISMLLITTAISAVGTTNDKIITNENPITSYQPFGGGLDQQQTKQDGMGFNIVPEQWLAQGFKPTKEKLASVQLYIFKHDNPPEGIEITVSIRESLNGVELAIANESADQIEDYKWVTFNFPEINVTPEKQYYIICRSDGGSGMDVYCWFYANDNPYDRGDAWMSADEGNIWSKFETDPSYNYPDFCFKTYSKKTNNLVSEPEQTPIGVVWSDNFDSYTLGQLLDGTSDDGGWNLCGCPYQSDGAYVVDDQFLSSPHSVEIAGYTDIIHEFTGINSGVWTFSDWIYIPTDSTCVSAICLDSYHPIPWDDWNLMRQLGVIFNGEDGTVECLPSAPPLTLIKGQWVELRVEIDLEADWLECYYDNELLIEKKWTDDIFPGYKGYRNLACLTISYTLANGPIEIPHYHDDFSIDGEGTGLIPVIQCEGELSWTCKRGAILTGEFTVENIGDPGSRLEWLIEEYPLDLGTWTFDPPRGSLVPEDGEQTVTVTLETKKEGAGIIKIPVIGESNDYCEIPVQVIFPRNRIKHFDQINWLFESFPNAFPIIRQVLGFL